ncbi:MAG: LacI family DNA-binding transcriptional regulator [Anaerolineae bacterium]
MAATIRDVAKAAGVGVGTVSRVLNNSPFVSQPTRERVLAAMAALDYQPSPTARRLALGRTHTIGVITPFFTRPAFVGRLNGILAELTATNYDLVLFSINTPEQRDACFQDVSKFKSVDGMIIIALGVQDADATVIKHWNVPTVLLDSHHPDLPSIAIDDTGGGRLATEHLIALGHRKIAFIGDTFDNPFGFISSQRRYLGYRQALETAGFRYRPAYQRLGDHGRYVAHQLALELLELHDPPTAIFAASDTQALGVLEAAHARGLRVPEDLSVIGYDDIEIAEYLDLTTIHQPMYSSGQQAATLLFELLSENPPEETHILLPVEVVQRGTTAPPRTAHG